MTERTTADKTVEKSTPSSSVNKVDSKNSGVKSIVDKLLPNRHQETLIAIKNLEKFIHTEKSDLEQTFAKRFDAIEEKCKAIEMRLEKDIQQNVPPMHNKMRVKMLQQVLGQANAAIVVREKMITCMANDHVADALMMVTGGTVRDHTGDHEVADDTIKL
jgi:hypothetical protein